MQSEIIWPSVSVAQTRPRLISFLLSRYESRLRGFVRDAQVPASGPVASRPRRPGTPAASPEEPHRPRCRLPDPRAPGPRQRHRSVQQESDAVTLTRNERENSCWWCVLPHKAFSSIYVFKAQTCEKNKKTTLLRPCSHRGCGGARNWSTH